MEIHTKLMSTRTSFLNFVTIKFRSLKREMERFLFSHRANTCSCRTKFLLMHGLSVSTPDLPIEAIFGFLGLSNVPKKLQGSGFWIIANTKAISYNVTTFFRTISLLWAWTGGTVMKYLPSHG